MKSLEEYNYEIDKLYSDIDDYYLKNHITDDSIIPLDQKVIDKMNKIKSLEMEKRKLLFKNL